MFDGLSQDAVYALRILRKNPAFALTAILTLALGIGANTAIFTVVRAVLLKPLEYRNPDRLVYFSSSNSKRFGTDLPFSSDRLQQMRVSLQSFAGLGAFLASPETMTLSGEGDPESLRGARVSANFLDVLGVKPILGRGFIASEDEAGGPYVAIISQRLWRVRFGADPAIAGKSARFDATPYTIVGVLPQGFEFPLTGADVWVPRPSEWSRFAGSRYWRNLPVLVGFGALKPDVTIEQARAEMAVASRQYNNAHPGLDQDATMQVVWLKDKLVSNLRPMLWILFGAVGFVLLISCANVASLMLARATSRSREFAVRAALGAQRSRLIRQLLAESLILAMAGGAIGLMLAKLASRAFTLVDAMALSSRVNPIAVPGSGALRLDLPVLLFSIGLSVATGVFFGLFPSLHASRPDLVETLRESGASRSPGKRRLLGLSPRGLLVIGQVALSVILLVGAALLLRSFVRLSGVNPGFRPQNLLTMKIALPPARYDTDQKKAAFFNQLVPRLEALPGVRRAAMAMSLPATTWVRTNITKVEGQPNPDSNDPSIFGVIESVTPGYFQTMGIAMRAGREFTARDNTPGAPPAIIINEHLARRFWPDFPRDNPVGRHIGEGFDKFIDWFEIVGVVADTHEGGLAADAVSEFYVPCILHPPQTAFIATRTEGDPLQLANAVRAQVLAVDRDQSVSDVRTMEMVLEATLGQRRLTMILIGSFAGAALLLALIGIYGMVTYSVAQRTQEVGIRRALGARYADILKLILSQGLALVMTGVALGAAGALWLTRLMNSMLFQVSSSDPATYLGVTALLLVVALAASFLPARRASRIDPMSALR
jgi:putative ABC transport system permease protein